jgi:hypothetical protein
MYLNMMMSFTDAQWWKRTLEGEERWKGASWRWMKNRVARCESIRNVVYTLIGMVIRCVQIHCWYVCHAPAHPPILSASDGQGKANQLLSFWLQRLPSTIASGVTSFELKHLPVNEGLQLEGRIGGEQIKSRDEQKAFWAFFSRV